MQPYYSTDTSTAVKNSGFIWSDFHVVVNQLIAVHVLPMHVLASLSVDEIYELV